MVNRRELAIRHEADCTELYYGTRPGRTAGILVFQTHFELQLEYLHIPAEGGDAGVLKVPAEWRGPYHERVRVACPAGREYIPGTSGMTATRYGTTSVHRIAFKPLVVQPVVVVEKLMI